MYSSTTNETVVLLGHFDSSNAPHIAEYVKSLIGKMLARVVIKITLIPSTTSFTFAGVKTKSILQEYVCAGARTLTPEVISKLQGTSLVHMYDMAVMAIMNSLPCAEFFRLAPFPEIEGMEDVCIDVHTGEIRRYTEVDSRVVSLTPQKENCLREDFNIPYDMELYFLEGGELRLIKFADDVASAPLLQVSLSSSLKQSELPLLPASSTSLALKVLGHYRKGLKEVPTVDLPKLLKLPSGYIIGAAIDDGGCFFDALAQALNQTRNTEEFSEKMLRLCCHQYYTEHKDEVDQWNAIDGVGGGVKGDDYFFVQYTKPELDKDFNSRIPLWGRPQIEGRMLCHQLEIERFHWVELGTDPENEQPMLTHFEITANGEKQIDALPYDGNIPTIIVSQKSLHFVPILHNKADLEQGKGNPSIFGKKEEEKPKPLLKTEVSSIAPQLYSPHPQSAHS